MTSNTVTQEEIYALLEACETQEHCFWGKELVVSYKLPCGFTISGRAACVDPANFNLQVGRNLAKRDVERQLWQFEGYRKQLEVYGRQTAEATHDPS